MHRVGSAREQTKENRNLEYIKWLTARDIFCGFHRRQDLALGLELAEQCEHEDAMWLCEVFRDWDVTLLSATAARSVCLSQPKDNSKRALFFAALLCHAVDPLYERRGEWVAESARLGYVPAMAIAASFFSSHTAQMVEWISTAATQGDREGMCELGLRKVRRSSHVSDWNEGCTPPHTCRRAWLCDSDERIGQYPFKEKFSTLALVLESP
jgi:hypothetical protein